MRGRRFALALALTAGLLASLAPATHAQSSSAGITLVPGTEVRLLPRHESAPQRRGRVVVLERDTIVLRDDAGLSRTALRDLAALDVRGGEDKRRGFLRGAAIAVGITAVFGGIDLGTGDITTEDFIGTMIANSLIGGLVGYAFAPKGWERIPLPESR